ncbi:M56 family metallopeptidase [Bacillus marasmi]|uniref:M56 family metallopeptidase n=1 Tax=Bacillus marasmi TaxID=1926279 RepID=UPI0011C83E45|nr:M56 family metallopeptidase [Bacillus marasmi]
MKDIFMNHYFLQLFDWIIETSIYASLLVCLILIIKTLLKSRLSPRWHYLLWFVLIVRMIVPWSPLDFSIYSFLPKETEIVTGENETEVAPKNGSVPELSKPSSNQGVDENLFETSNLPVPKELNSETITTQNEKKETPISIYNVAYVIWLAGVLIFSIGTYLINRKLHNYIKHKPVVTDNRVLTILQNCKKSMSIKRSIPLQLSGNISSPTVLGYFRPKILISNLLINQLTDQQLQHIFLHELSHIKRRDVGVNWLMHILLILNWFNPILWWAYYCMREDQELACDAYALTFMADDEKLSYGNTIISLLEKYAKYYQTPSLANLSRNKRSIKRRIILIKKFEKKSYRWSALGIFTIIIVSVFSLINTQAQGSNEKHEEATKTKESTQNEKNGSIYTPPIKKESYEEMSKEEVVFKLLNTVDYFHTAVGKFESRDQYNGESTGTVKFEFQISNKDVIGGYEKYMHVPDENLEITSVQNVEEYYNDKTLWTLNPDRMIYQIHDYKVEPKKEKVTPEDAFSIELNKIYDSRDKFRERPPIGIASGTIFPYEETSKYLRFTNLWEIENQNEKLLGHNTIVLFGKIDNSIINDMQPDVRAFRFWVDKDTGFLLKREIYNDKGDIISYLHPESLSVNVPINKTQFVPALKDYQELKLGELPYKDKREKDIEVIEHADNKKEEVEDVVKIIRTKVPSLFEFSNPDLQLFSASLEKYKKYYHAYFVYYYNKDVEDDHISRVIYVRSYHKKSVVKSIGDFGTDRGNKLETFEFNGIKWSAYEVKNTPDIHLIGSLGDYKYEMVLQGISLDETKGLLPTFVKITE